MAHQRRRGAHLKVSQRARQLSLERQREEDRDEHVRSAIRAEDWNRDRLPPWLADATTTVDQLPTDQEP